MQAFLSWEFSFSTAIAERCAGLCRWLVQAYLDDQQRRILSQVDRRLLEDAGLAEVGPQVF